ncbi:TIR domain-containing protein [Macrococcus bovicus]|nr:nucleotide-binding protein [Macrococcus bovicus]
MDKNEINLALEEIQKIIDQPMNIHGFLGFVQRYEDLETFVDIYANEEYFKSKYKQLSMKKISYSGAKLDLESQHLAKTFKKRLLKLREVAKDLDAERESEVSVIASQNCNEKENKIFIVHGHDGSFKHEVARIIEKQGIKVSILAELSNRHKTILDKFIDEIESCRVAIILYTPDDLLDDSYQARPNVIFEHGYAIAKLGRENVIMMKKADDKNLELHSDIHGVLYTNANDGGWKLELLKELRDIGFELNIDNI